MRYPFGKIGVEGENNFDYELDEEIEEELKEIEEDKKDPNWKKKALQLLK